ncbi:MAG: PASTA domain-containing protein, partial [Acidimicrobiia bacterium]|nr:PASTA domain-containing protein [Acidimicrobiia bacterium]
AARDELRKAGFNNVKFEREVVAERAQRGVVLRQTPAAGEEVAPDGRITVVVGTGPNELDVPAVDGLEYDDARKLLEAAGFPASNIQRIDVSSSEMQKGRVVRTEPSGKAEPTDIIRVLVSSGPAQAPVPDVVGLSEADALTALQGAGFTVATKTDELRSGDTKIGTVTKQDPGAGSTEDVGSKVTITVGVEKPGSSTTSTSSSSTSSTSTTTGGGGSDGNANGGGGNGNQQGSATTSGNG